MEFGLFLFYKFSLPVEGTCLDKFVHELAVDPRVDLLVPENDRDHADGLAPEWKEVSEGEELVVAAVVGDIELKVALEKELWYPLDALALEKLKVQGLRGVLQNAFEKTKPDVRLFHISLKG